MKKNYVNPMTKVISINCKTIMETQVAETSNVIDPDDNITETPLF